MAGMKEVGPVYPTPEETLHDAALTVVELALARYGVEDLDDLTPQRRKNCLRVIKTRLQALGIIETTTTERSEDRDAS